MRSHALGKAGEEFALGFLTREGYKIIKANYRTKVGEIDLVADDKGTIVFIEVKTRQEDGWDAFEAVSRSKQRKMAKVALQYLVERFGRDDVQARFDVLAVYEGEDGAFKADLLKNAFYLS